MCSSDFGSDLAAEDGWWIWSMSCKSGNIVVFPRIVSDFILLRNFGKIIYDISSKYNGRLELSQLRKLEKISTKTQKADLEISFLKSCQRFNVFPKFICFQLPNVSKFDVIGIRKRLLKSAISERCKERRRLQIEKDRLENKIKHDLTGIDYFIFHKALLKNINREVHHTLQNHQKKLRMLTKNCILPFDSKETVTTISSHKLTFDENEALIFPPYIKKTDVFACFESIYQSMNSHLMDKNNVGKVKADLSHLAQTYGSSCRPSQKDIKTHKTLNQRRRNKESVLLKPDKGNGVVVLNRSDYIKGILDIVSDSNKFKDLANDPTICREGKVQRFLRNKNGTIDNDIYSQIYPTGSQPARRYGLPKMHKSKSPNVVPPFRPIVSSIRTYNYQVAKYLCNPLQPHIPNTYTISDSFSFVQELNTIDISNKYMVSFDVKSLFTNIPLRECIDFAVSYNTDENTNLKLSKDDLVKLFSLATAQTHFLFDGKVFDQIDGVAMGSPLAPVLAKLFLGHHEHSWLSKYKGPSIQFYRRYVDDTFCLFNNEQDVSLFFDFLNSQHDNIKFTMEKESNNTLAFLDIFINNKDPSNLITSVYRKKTFTGLLTDLFSFTSFLYKLGLIQTLLNRAYKLNNTLQGFNEDVKKLSYTLRKNQFPDGLIQKVVKGYLDNINRSTALSAVSTSPIDLCTLYFKLPYLSWSNFTKRKLQTLVKRYCKDLKIKLVFSSFTIKNLIDVKDSVPKTLHSNVVYKFNCAECDSVYVGETSRHLST